MREVRDEEDYEEELRFLYIFPSGDAVRGCF